jgi:hypothetical protein
MQKTIKNKFYLVIFFLKILIPIQHDNSYTTKNILFYVQFIHFG